MLSSDSKHVFCDGDDNEDCTNCVPNHRFGKIRASDAGWFFSRDDKVAHCPDHLPDWVREWRNKKGHKNTDPLHATVEPGEVILPTDQDHMRY